MNGTNTMERPCTTTPTIGGILSIFAGVFHISFFVILPLVFRYFSLTAMGIFSTLGGFNSWRITVLISGILAIIGGILAIKRQHWWFALSGVVFSLLPTMLLGIVAVILVAKSKREFSS